MNANGVNTDNLDPEKIKIALPGYVSEIIAHLWAAGRGAWAVGGCVRDALMGRVPSDWDITTSAWPEETEACFLDIGWRVKKTGLKHGTLTVVPPSGEAAEVTSHRLEFGYGDHRRPDRVVFSRELSDDLGRRDFTINAMAYNDRTGLVDLFEGRRHLGEKLVACVGEPGERFSEDALRIMRALRFAAALDFEIEERTAAAIFEHAGLLGFISAERVYAELVKLICGPGAGRVLARFGDIVKAAVPGLGVSSLACRALEFAPADKYARLALLLYGGEGSAARSEAILRGLHAEGAAVRAVRDTLSRLGEAIPSGRRETGLYLASLTPETALRVLSVRRALAAARGDGAEIAAIGEAEALAARLISEGVCFSAADLTINGDDLAAAGIAPGPEMGKILNELVRLAAAGEIENQRFALIQLLENRN